MIDRIFWISFLTSTSPILLYEGSSSEASGMNIELDILPLNSMEKSRKLVIVEAYFTSNFLIISLRLPIRIVWSISMMVEGCIETEEYEMAYSLSPGSAYCEDVVLS